MYFKKIKFLLLTISVSFCLISCQIKEVKRGSDIELNCPEEIGDKKVACTAKIPGTNAVLNATIKKRGQSSRVYPKSSYAIEFELNVGFCVLPGDDDWVLTAAYIDKTLMRNRLCYDLFRLMAPENFAPQICYQTISLNGVSQGIYLVTERIDSKRIGINKLSPGAFLFKEPAIFSELSSDKTRDRNYLGQKYPKPNEADLTDSLLILNQSLLEFDELAFRQLMHDHFDLNNLADWLLILYFSNNDDGLFRNFYLHRKQASQPIRIAIWDYDESFGRLGDGTLDDGSLKINFDNHLLLGRLLKWDEFQKRLKDRWTVHRKLVFTESAINAQIDSYLKELKPMIEENKLLWPPDGPGYKDSSTFEEEFLLLRNSISKRLTATDSFVHGL